MDDRPGKADRLTRLRAAEAWLDRALSAIACGVQWAFEAGRSWGLVAFLVGASPGLFLWPVIRHDRLGYVLDNELGRWLRLEALGVVLGSIGLMAAIYAAVAIRTRRKDGSGAVVPALRRLGDRLLGLLVLPFVPPLLVRDLGEEAPLLSLLVAAGAAIAAAVAVYRFPRIDAWPRVRLPSWTPVAALALLTVAYAVVMTLYSINQHHNLRTSAYDMGLYDNIFWNTVHGRPLATNLVRGGVHTAAHVDPLLILLSPLYMLYPRAELLLGLQSVWLAATAVPLFLLARRHLARPWVALAIAVTLLLYPALHGVNLYHFHSLALVAPLLAWSIYCVEVGAVRWFAVPFTLMLLAREDAALVGIFVGFYAILSRRAPRLGVVAIAGAAAYLVCVKLFVMPEASLLMENSGESYSFAHYFEDLIPYRREGVGGLVLSLLINPFFALKHVFTEAKTVFLAVLFLPVLFLPLVAGRGKVMLIYGLAFTLLASRDAVFSVHFQYTSMLYPVIFMLVPIALEGLPSRRLVGWLELDARRLATALVAGMLVASVAVTVEHGGLVPNDSFRAGYGRLAAFMNDESRATYEWVRAAVERIPPDATVSASSRLVPHVSNRRDVYRFPAGWGADYLFVDDKNLDAAEQAHLKRLRREAYEVVVEREGGMALLKRRPGVALPSRRGDPPEARPAPTEPPRARARRSPATKARSELSIQPRPASEAVSPRRARAVDDRR